MREAIRSYSGESCLEIGTGNGGALEELSRNFPLAIGTDILRPSMPVVGELVVADRASCFRDRVFDVVVFNPPYLRSDGIEDVTVDGGRLGTEVSLGFLEDALRCVKRDGKIVMLLSSENPLEEFQEACEAAGFRMSLVASERLFYESLLVYVASISDA